MAKSDPRVIKTLRQIDNALLENLAQYPFPQITIDMICTSALINRSTFYKYYKDKYDLLDKYLDRILSEFRQSLKTDFILASPTDIDDLFYQKIFHDVVEFLHKNRGKYTVLWEANIGRQVYNEMLEIIRDNILDKLQPNPPEDTDLFRYQSLYAVLFASNLMTLTRWWFSNENAVSATDIEQIMNSNMKSGLFAAFKQYIGFTQSS